MNLVKRLARLFPSLALGFVLVTAACTAKQVHDVENAVFTAENIACMVTPLLSGQLSGPAADVANVVMAECQIAPALTKDVVAFIDAFTNATPAQVAKWQQYAADHAAK